MCGRLAFLGRGEARPREAHWREPRSGSAAFHVKRAPGGRRFLVERRWLGDPLRSRVCRQTRAGRSREAALPSAPWALREEAVASGFRSAPPAPRRANLADVRRWLAPCPADSSHHPVASAPVQRTRTGERGHRAGRCSARPAWVPRFAWRRQADGPLHVKRGLADLSFKGRSVESRVGETRRVLDGPRRTHPCRGLAPASVERATEEGEGQDRGCGVSVSPRADGPFHVKRSSRAGPSIEGCGGWGGASTGDTVTQTVARREPGERTVRASRVRPRSSCADGAPPVGPYAAGLSRDPSPAAAPSAPNVSVEGGTPEAWGTVSRETDPEVGARCRPPRCRRLAGARRASLGSPLGRSGAQMPRDQWTRKG